jgi:RecA-family ATPase
MQAAILWGLGRECFGIVPVKPLKSLLIQAENDAGDLAEMRDGVIAGLDLTPGQAQTALANIVVACEDTSTLTFANVPDDENQKVGKRLERYCGQGTERMIWIVDVPWQLIA